MRGVGFDRLPPPPRRVPASLRLALWLGGLRQVGCFLVAVGAPFAWLITPHVDWRSALFVGRPLVTTDASIVESEPTGLREGRRGVYDPVHRVRFQFAAAGGGGVEGVSWGTGAGKAGERARVEFPDGRPELARVVGMRGAPLDLLGVLVPVCYAFPLLAAAAGSARLKRQAHLLRRGVYLLARLEESQHWTGPDARRHRLPEAVRDLPDGAPLPLLYDPARPSEAEPVTRFSWLVAIAPDGSLVPPRAGLVLWLLLLPGLALLSNLASFPLVGVLR